MLLTSTRTWAYENNKTMNTRRHVAHTHVRACTSTITDKLVMSCKLQLCFGLRAECKKHSAASAQGRTNYLDVLVTVTAGKCQQDERRNVWVHSLQASVPCSCCLHTPAMLCPANKDDTMCTTVISNFYNFHYLSDYCIPLHMCNGFVNLLNIVRNY